MGTREVAPHRPRGRLTGELGAAMQSEISERHVLKCCNVTCRALGE